MPAGGIILNINGGRNGNDDDTHSPPEEVKAGDGALQFCPNRVLTQCSPDAQSPLLSHFLLANRKSIVSYNLETK